MPKPNPWEETWKPVVGYEGVYDITDTGRMRSHRRLSSTGAVLQAGPKYSKSNAKGYLVAGLWRDGKCKYALVHRLVLEAFVGPCPEGMEGCHNDGDPMNNWVGNLRWDTHSENGYDRVRHGRHDKANRTHCPRGHRLIAPNLIEAGVKRGHRGCLACSRKQHLARKLGWDEVKVFADAEYERIMAA